MITQEDLGRVRDKTSLAALMRDEGVLAQAVRLLQERIA